MKVIDADVEPTAPRVFDVEADGAPAAWMPLYLIEVYGKNKDRYCYRLRFRGGKDEDGKRLSQHTLPGGPITDEIRERIAQRRGKGRHKESRLDASRYSARSDAIARRLQRGTNARTPGA
jgi:hypothetical protein